MKSWSGSGNSDSVPATLVTLILYVLVVVSSWAVTLTSTTFLPPTANLLKSKFSLEINSIVALELVLVASVLTVPLSSSPTITL
jgi:hypothetical protein